MINTLQTAEDLESVFLALHADLYGYIMARVRVREVAEDITQDIFIKAWEKRAQFDPKRGSLKNWLYGIALNAMRDHFRRQKHRATEELDDTVADESDVKGDAAVAQLHEKILEQVRMLSPKEQDLLTLRYMQGLSIEDIAEVLHMRYSATKVALHRATKKLQKRCNHFSS